MCKKNFRVFLGFVGVVIASVGVFSADSSAGLRVLLVLARYLKDGEGTLAVCSMNNTILVISFDHRGGDNRKP